LGLIDLNYSRLLLVCARHFEYKQTNADDDNMSLNRILRTVFSFTNGSSLH